MQADQLRQRLPLVVAVTGHRDILAEDVPVLQAQVGALIDELRRDFPHTPLRMLNALAEGADRLAARVALDREVELVVPLPMPQADYEQDFPDSIGEFRALLAEAAAPDPQRVFTLPTAPGNAAADITVHGEARNRQYEQAGAYVVQHCHVLLALWDGQPSDKVGGTAHVVRFKLEGVSAPYQATAGPLDLPDRGAVFHVPTRRRGGGHAADWQGAQTRGLWRYPADRDEGFRRRIYGFVDDFNAGSGDLDADDLARSRSYVLPADVDPGAENRRLLDIYACADQLAVRYRTLTHRFVAGMLVLAGTMALAFETYAHLLVRRPVLVLYLLCFLAIVGLYRWHRKLYAKTRYLDYRALAEGLRVQLFWRLGGNGENVAFHYLNKQSGELQWIREALRGMNAVLPQGPPRHDLVERHWIRDQAAYFQRAARRDHHRMERLEVLANWLYGLGLALSVAVVIFWAPLEHSHGLHHVLIVVMGFLPVVAALWSAYAEKTALREQSKQYDRMAVVYRRALDYLERLRAGDSCTTTCLDELVLALGKEALAENGDWVMLHRERPIEIPKGG